MRVFKFLSTLLLLGSFSCYSFADSLEDADKYISQDKFQEAAEIYKNYLIKHPHDKTVYINYIEMERVLGNFNHAMSLLDVYHKLFGQDKIYLMTKARVYTDAEYYDSALAINAPLNIKHPNDSYIMGTQASALFQSGRRMEGLAELNDLIKKYPHSDDIDYLSLLIKKPIQSSVSLGSRFTELAISSTPLDIPTSPQYIHQNDSVNIERIPLLLQVFLDANTSLIFKAQYETLSANSNSDSSTNTGRSTIADNEVYVGFDRFFIPRFDLRVLIGDLNINNGKSFLIYNLSASILPAENYLLTIQALRELFRPTDVTNGSPRSVSLGVLETGGRAHVKIKPSLQSTVDIDLRGSSLSDNNNYARLAVEPGLNVLNTDRTNLQLGLNLEWLSFNKNLSSTDGYYSPLFYQNYEIVGLLEVQAIPKLLLELYAGAGAMRDEDTAGYGPSTDVGIEGKYNFNKNIELVAEVDYSTRALSPFYSEYLGSLGLTWRFDQ